jgi:hypothetical protein
MPSQRKQPRSLTIHPILVAILPVLFLYAHNLREARLTDLWLPVLMVAGASVIVWTALGLLLRDVIRSALVTSFFWVWFFSFGHVRGLLSPAPAAGFAISMTAIFVIVYCALLVVGGALLMQRRPWLPALSSGLSVGAAALVLWNLSIIGVHEAKDLRLGRPPPASVAPSNPLPRTARPDIYYVVLDMYARADVLRDIYGYDNSAFLDDLTRRGFRVVPHARANYCETPPSLSALLNFSYVHQGAPAERGRGPDLRPLTEMLDHNRLFQFLRQRGYRIVTFASGVASTSMTDVDLCIDTLRGPSEFQNALLNTTPVPLLLAAIRPSGMGAVETHMRRIQYTFDHLADVTQLKPPIFVFAHIICPHPPFLFDHSGPRKALPTVLEWGDRIYDESSRRSYRRDYVEQLRFVNGKVTATVDALLSRARRPTVIIIASDHGPSSKTNWSSAEKTDLREKFGILLAWKLPEGQAPPEYDEISPVNIFRVVLDRCFNAGLGLLPDESYFPIYHGPEHFARVTDRARAGAAGRISSAPPKVEHGYDR